MSVLVIGAIIISLFFAAGVVLGVTVIISLSVAGRRGRPDRTWPQHRYPPHLPRPPGPGPGPGPDPGHEADPGDDTDTGCSYGPPHWTDSGPSAGSR